MSRAIAIKCTSCGLEIVGVVDVEGVVRASRSPFVQRRVLAVGDEGSQLDCGHVREARVSTYVGGLTNCYDCGREQEAGRADAR